MKQQIINEKILTQYLLGMLPQEKREELESQIFTDTHIFDELVAFEDELIDDYLYGRLNRRQCKYFEEQFLNTSDRRKKFEYAKTFNSSLDEWIAEQKVTESTKTSKFSHLTHNELIRLMGQNPSDYKAWHEFLKRFQNFIAAAILNECKRLNYAKSSETLGDLLHAVYLKLLMNNSKALRSFKGQYENSIVRYLQLIAINVVRSKMNVASRSVSQKLALNAEYLATIFPDISYQNKTKEDEIGFALANALQKIQSKRRNGRRDVLIFRYHFFEQFDVESIATLPEFARMSQKRIANILAEIKTDLRDFLAEKLAIKRSR